MAAPESSPNSSYDSRVAFEIGKTVASSNPLGSCARPNMPLILERILPYLQLSISPAPSSRRGPRELSSVSYLLYFKGKRATRQMSASAFSKTACADGSPRVLLIIGRSHATATSVLQA
jgi:hypothetical protein